MVSSSNSCSFPLGNKVQRSWVSKNLLKSSTNKGVTWKKNPEDVNVNPPKALSYKDRDRPRGYTVDTREDSSNYEYKRDTDTPKRGSSVSWCLIPILVFSPSSKETIA